MALTPTTWPQRHRILTWAGAWAVAGVGLFVADIFSEPRRGPLWVAIVFGMLGWGIAGAVTTRLDRPARMYAAVIWASSYVIAMLLGLFWVTTLDERNLWAPFVGVVFGWAVGGAIGGAATGYLSTAGETFQRLLASGMSAAAWGGAFLVAAYPSIVLAVYTAQAAKSVFAFLGSQRVALAIGWAIGHAVGGAIASAIGTRAYDAIVGRSASNLDTLARIRRHM